MNERVLPAVIIALGLTIAGFCASGRYSLTANGQDVWRLDRYTGQLWLCGASAEQKLVGCLKVDGTTNHQLSN